MADTCSTAEPAAPETTMPSKDVPKATPDAAAAKDAGGKASTTGAGDKWRHAWKALDTIAREYPLLVKVSSQAGTSPGTAAAGIIVSVGLLSFLAFGGVFVANVFALTLPAYSSFKAVRSEHFEDDKQWLTYWVVFAFMSLLESTASWTLYWIPFYWVLKTAALYWLWQVMGATWVYEHAAKPAMMLVSKQIAKVNAPPAKRDGKARSASRAGEGDAPATTGSDTKYVLKT